MAYVDRLPGRDFLRPLFLEQRLAQKLVPLLPDQITEKPEPRSPLVRAERTLEIPNEEIEKPTFTNWLDEELDHMAVHLAHRVRTTDGTLARTNARFSALGYFNLQTIHAGNDAVKVNVWMEFNQEVVHG